jgi:HSP20 family molecular chaperone IbpA
MSDISRHQPGRQLSEWFDWFDSGWPSWGELWRGATHPIRIEDKIENDRYVLRAELPGIDPEKDVEVTVENGVLSVSAERQERTTEKGRSEFRYGSFRRRVTLPQGAQENAVEANYRDGILEITVPISTTGSASRSIRVQRQGSSAGQSVSSTSAASGSAASSEGSRSSTEDYSEPSGDTSAEPGAGYSQSGGEASPEAGAGYAERSGEDSADLGGDAAEPSAGAAAQPGLSAEFGGGPAHPGAGTASPSDAGV